MKIGKISNLVDNRSRELEDILRHLQSVDVDLENMILLSKGRVRFGSGADGDRGENVAGEFQVITTHGTPDTETGYTHTLGSTPIGYIVLNKDKAGHIYDGTTSNSASTIYLRSDVASVTATIFLLK